MSLIYCSLQTKTSRCIIDKLQGIAFNDAVNRIAFLMGKIVRVLAKHTGVANDVDKRNVSLTW